MTIGLIIIIFLGALPCIFLWYLIAVKQKRELIAGWNESKVSNPNAYAKLVGYSVFILGILIGITGMAWFVGLLNEIQMVVVIFIISLIPIPYLLIANSKYAN